MRDLHNRISVTQLLACVAVAAAGDTDSAIFSRDGSMSQEIILTADVVTGTAKLTVIHGDEADLSDGAVATSADLDILGDETLTLAADGVLNLGYVGNKLYYKARVVSAGVAVDQTFSVVNVASELHFTGSV